MRPLQAAVLVEFRRQSLGKPFTVAQLHQRCGSPVRLIRSALTSLMLEGYIQPGEPIEHRHGRRTPTYVRKGGTS